MEDSVAILSDTQSTLAPERWFLGRKQYNDVRDRAVTSLLEKKPTILILNGDLTAIGSSQSEWAYWRSWMRPLLDSSIEIWPWSMGNHDYL